MKPLFRHLPNPKIRLGLLVLNLLVVAMAGFALADSYFNHRALAVASSQNLSTVLAESVDGLIGRIDGSLYGIIDEAEDELGNGPFTPKVLQPLLDHQLQRQPSLDSVRLVDANGIAILGTNVDPANPVDLSDRAFFSALRDNPSAGLFISQPLEGRPVKRWLIIFARRINKPDGSFGGIVLASVTVDQFVAKFSQLDLGEDGGAALRGPDLGVMARYPSQFGGLPATGQKLISPGIVTAVAANPILGTIEVRTPVDGIERIVSYHKVGETPLYVMVGLATSGYLRDWWHDAEVMGGLVALFLITTTVGAVMLSRSWESRALAHRQLQASAADLEQFAEVLTHHLQEPVRLQHLFAQYLRNLLPAALLSDETREALDNITAGATRLRALLRDVHAYLRAGQAGPPANPGDSNLALVDTLESLRDKIAERGVAIEQTPLPPARIAEAEMARVLYALIDNAIDYRSPDRAPHVTISGWLDGGMAVINVADNGIGIPAEYRQRVFKVFERLDRDDHRAGTGVGLALARKIVEAAGGTVHLDEAKGGGTVVVITLPA